MSRVGLGDRKEQAMATAVGLAAAEAGSGVASELAAMAAVAMPAVVAVERGEKDVVKVIVVASRGAASFALPLLCSRTMGVTPAQKE